MVVLHSLDELHDAAHVELLADLEHEGFVDVARIHPARPILGQGQ